MNLTNFLQQRREHNAPVILDGAVGTELQRRGFAVDDHPLWSVHALTDWRGKYLLGQVHADYADAAPDMLTANTVRINPRLLDRHGLLGKGAQLTREAVTIARKASNGCFVAGSMSPLESCYTPSLVPEEEVLRSAHRLTAAWMSAAGLHLLMIDTITTIREAEAALSAVLERGIPAAVSFCCGKDGNLLGGERLIDAIQAIDGRVLAIAVNCVDFDYIRASLRILRDHATGDRGFYANFGALDPKGNWRPLSYLTPEFFASYAEVWRASGLRWIGGCCGSTPDHIRALSRQWRQWEVAS
jgi:homocysteine S-methyltransferase